MSNPPNNYYEEGSVSKLQRKARESPVMPIGKKRIIYHREQDKVQP